MERMGFMMETVTDYRGRKKRCIQMTEIEGTEYVHFYKDGHIIPIPYECLVYHTAEDLAVPECSDPNIAGLEKLLIDIQKKLSE